MPKNHKEFKEQIKKDQVKRRKNLQEIRKEEKRKITLFKLQTLFILDKFRKMYLENTIENGNILIMFKEYFNSYKSINNKEEFVNNLFKEKLNIMVLSNLYLHELKEFVNDFS